MVVWSCVAARAQQADRGDWGALSFMQGKWVGEGTSEAGQGAGWFTFEPDLQGKVWIRRNHAEYPAAGNRPPTVHEDVMIVYADAAANATRAFYTDSEGHTFGYRVAFSADRRQLIFTSEPQRGQPRYRLTYVRLGPERMSVVLEMADPDHPDDFKKIVEGVVRKT
jgi:hypothetical protein